VQATSQRGWLPLAPSSLPAATCHGAPLCSSLKPSMRDNTPVSAPCKRQGWLATSSAALPPQSPGGPVPRASARHPAGRCQARATVMRAPSTALPCTRSKITMHSPLPSWPVLACPPGWQQPTSSYSLCCCGAGGRRLLLLAALEVLSKLIALATSDDLSILHCLTSI